MTPSSSNSSETLQPPVEDHGPLVTTAGEPLLDLASPTREQLESQAFFIGTESVGTDAWRVYRLMDGREYRVVDYPKVSPDLGRVYAYNSEGLPPPYVRPELRRGVTEKETAEFARTGVSQTAAALRVEVARVRAEERQKEREAARRQAWETFRTGVSDRQHAQWIARGFYDIIGPYGQRFRVVPRTRHVYQIGTRDEPLRTFWFPEERILPDAAARYITQLAADPGTFFARADSRPYAQDQAPWPLAEPEIGSEAAGRIYALEIV